MNFYSLAYSIYRIYTTVYTPSIVPLPSSPTSHLPSPIRYRVQRPSHLVLPSYIEASPPSSCGTHTYIHISLPSPASSLPPPKHPIVQIFKTPINIKSFPQSFTRPPKTTPKTTFNNSQGLTKHPTPSPASNPPHSSAAPASKRSVSSSAGAASTRGPSL